jgi:Arc/MetJ family transcription regulator
MMHTNITIDAELLRVAMVVSDISTNEVVVEQALQEFITRHRKKDLRDLRGKIQFYDGYDYKALRNGRS